MRVVLLGSFQVWLGERAVEPSAWRLNKAKDVIKLLALARGNRMQRDQVLELLWPDRAPDSAVNNLYQVLHAARRAIDSVDGDGHALLRLEAETLTLCRDDALWVDADEFESSARRALASHLRSDYDTALELYSGELLPDDRYADWAAGRRESLHRLNLELMRGLARALEDAGEMTAAADVLRQILNEDPTNEPAHRDLMRVYAASGDRGAAARQYDALETALHDELGVTPEQESQDLVASIVAGRLGPKDEGTLAPSRPKTNLGVALSTFVGREKELIELRELTSSDRMVTLLGAGGCGKTRLAVEVGRLQSSAFAGGVLLVELAPVVKASDVPSELMRAFDVRRGPDKTAIEAVADLIGEDEVLLIVDNCEHVVDGVAKAIDTLLSVCAGLTVLATSREPIRIPGEIVRRVSSLRAPDPVSLPPAGELLGYDAIRLFQERVRAVHGNFTVDESNAADVALVCSRLDGMPLALELAAARVPALSVAGVAKNLDDRFKLLVDGPRTALSRQRTLKATVDWSFDLLSESERALFLRLSVFHGPFDIEAARSLAGPELQGDVAGLLVRLVERSMIVTVPLDGEVRYRLLETMREYGQDRLRADGGLSEARDRHAQWLLELSHSGEGLSEASRRPDLVSRLSEAHDELRPAVEHLLAANPREAVRLTAQVWPYWLWLAHLGEGLELIEHVLEHVKGPSTERAELLIGASALAFRWKGFEEMERLAALSEAESEALGDNKGVCRALLFTAVGPFDRDEFQTARASFEKARRLARDEGDAPLELSANLCLAMLAASRLDYLEAGAILDRAESLVSSIDGSTGVLDLYTLGSWTPTRRRGERLHMWCETFVAFEDGIGRPAHASVVTARANLERLLGRFDRAASLLESALDFYEDLGDEGGQALVLSWMGQLAFDLGDLDAAESHLTRSLDLRRRIRHLRGVVASLVSIVRLMTDRAQIADATQYLDEAEELCRQRADRIGTALVRTERAQVAMAGGDAESSVSLLIETSPVVVSFGGFGLNIACLKRDIGEAQSLSGSHEQAHASLSEAADIFERNGYKEEADRCRRLMAGVGE